MQEIVQGQCEVAFLTAGSYARARMATWNNDDPDDDVVAVLAAGAVGMATGETIRILEWREDENEKFAVVDQGAGYRITSYNVCYTKLLRTAWMISAYTSAPFSCAMSQTALRSCWKPLMVETSDSATSLVPGVIALRMSSSGMRPSRSRTQVTCMPRFCISAYSGSEPKKCSVSVTM